MKKSLLLVGLEICCAVFLSSCISGPKVTPCVIDAVTKSGYCAPPDTNEVVVIPVGLMDSYTCYSPDDMQRLLEWIKRQQKRLGK